MKLSDIIASDTPASYEEILEMAETWCERWSFNPITKVFTFYTLYMLSEEENGNFFLVWRAKAGIKGSWKSFFKYLNKEWRTYHLNYKDDYFSETDIKVKELRF